MNTNNNNDDSNKDNFNEAPELDLTEQVEDLENAEGAEDTRLPLKKRNFRALLFHVLYAADTYDFETPVVEIVQSFNREYETDIELDSPIIRTVERIGKRRLELDDRFIPFLKNWKYDRIGYCTILILRYAIWEMLYTETHHNIIINEAIELAKSFAEKDAFKFANGILDKISKKIEIEKAEEAEARLNEEKANLLKKAEQPEDPLIERLEGDPSAEEIMDAALASIDEEEAQLTEDNLEE